MDDLISRAAAIEAFDDERVDRNYGDVSPESVIEVIESIPAVDAAPVVHGRWMNVLGYAMPGGDPVWKCSECGKGVHVYGIDHGSYGAEIADGQWVSCPNCGARMDGDAK